MEGINADVQKAEDECVEVTVKSLEAETDTSTEPEKSLQAETDTSTEPEESLEAETDTSTEPEKIKPTTFTAEEDPESLMPTTLAVPWGGVEEKLGFWGATSALVITMFGTSVVAVPYCFALCGYVFGPVLMAVIGALSYVSYVRLIRCTACEQVASYGALMRKLPWQWAQYTNVTLWALLVMITIGSVFVAADIIRSVLSHVSKEVSSDLQNPILFAIILVCIFPLCLIKSLHGLSLISTYCSGALIVVFGLIVWECSLVYINDKPKHSIAATSKTELSAVLKAVPILGNAMFGHMNMSQIYAEMQPKVKQRGQSVALVACAIVVLLYTAVGLVGYFAFGQLAMSDVVSQIATHGGETGAVVVLQALLASFVALKTPFLLIPLRNLTIAIVDPEMKLTKLSSSMRYHVLLTGALVACVYVGAMAIPSLVAALDVAGAVGVVPLIFFVPARIAWTIETPRPFWQCLTLAIFGSILLVFSLIAICS